MLEEILAFWLKEIDQNQWRSFDPSFDALLKKRFLDVLQQASVGELFAWRTKTRGRLTEVIVLDQFSRNIHRGTPLAFAQDPMMLVLSQEAVSAGAMSELNEEECSFFLMPVRLYAAIVSTNIRSTRSSPRTMTWRIRPTVLAEPKRNSLPSA